MQGSGYIYALDTIGDPLDGIVYGFKMIQMPSGTSGLGFSQEPRHAISASGTGLITELFEVGATYAVWAGWTAPKTYTTFIATSGTFAIPSILD